jgi:DNA-binding Lrp family transcriptional regulator
VFAAAVAPGRTKPVVIIWQQSLIAFTSHSQMETLMNSSIQTTALPEARLLDFLQTGFPLVARPFAALASMLNVTENDIIAGITSLKSSGVVRQIGPVINPQAIGFKTTLVAMKLDPSYMPAASSVLKASPGVSHAYEREHEFNLWVTLAAGPDENIDASVQRLAIACRASNVIALPAVKIYKLQALFGSKSQPATLPPAAVNKHILTAEQKRVLNALQQDLALITTPWDSLATSTGMETQQFLDIVRGLILNGVIRRYGANINHRKTGFTANAMTCWQVDANSADAIGAALTRLQAVSHCYLRQAQTAWPYNLFAMIHGQQREECTAVAHRISNEYAIHDCQLLFSIHEIKKIRNVYRV